MWSDILWFGIAFPCKWCWASFHVYVCHLYVFFRKMSVKIFCPFLNWIGYFFHIVVYEVKWKLLSRVRLFTTPWTIQSMEFPRQEYTGVGSHYLLQGIFPSQGSNPGLPHCRRILYRLNHQKIYCVVWVLFTFWILNPYQTIICNYLLPFGGFLVSWWFPSVQKLLSLISSHLFIFPFLPLTWRNRTKETKP